MLSGYYFYICGLIRFCMQRVVKYSILSFLSVIFCILTSDAMVRDFHTTENVVNREFQISVEVDVLSLPPYSLFANDSAELVFDISHFSSDTKFYTKLSNNKREYRVCHQNIQPVSGIACSFSYPDHTDYYVFGLRKIVV